jgi:hypothetical protein
MPGNIDLRSSDFAADGQVLDPVLDMLQQEPLGPRWRIGVVCRRRTQPFDPAAPGGLPLQPPPDMTALVQRRQAAQAGIEASLQQLAARFAGSTLPAAEALAPPMAPGFRHAGLDAATFIGLVLLRRDAPDDGGYALLGARIDALRVPGLRSEGAAWTRFTLRPRAPFAPRELRMGFVPGTAGWLVAGDGAAASLALRHALVLGPTGLDDAALRALPGLACVTDIAALAGEATRRPPRSRSAGAAPAAGCNATCCSRWIRTRSMRVSPASASAAARCRRWPRAAAARCSARPGASTRPARAARSICTRRTNFSSAAAPPTSIARPSIRWSAARVHGHRASR